MSFPALVAGAVLCLALIEAPEALAARTPCPPGAFVLETGGVEIGSMLGSPASVVEIDADGTIRLAGCETAGRVRAKKKFTKVAAAWSTCGTGTKVKLTGKIAAPACQMLAGKVKAKRVPKVPFTAIRLGGITTTSIPGGSTTSTVPGGTTTSTTIPVVCGNGVHDGTDECEGNDGCGASERCTATCTCEAVPPPPSTSQTLIAQARRDGVIDYPTSLVYRAWALFADSRLPPEYDGETWQSEDASLFAEIAGSWNNLDPATQDLLRPFTLRPSEVGSYWDPGPPGLVTNGGTGEPEDVECPYQPGASSPDWRSTPTTHFVIWSCGGGDPNQDPDAAARATVATMAESVWTAMVPETGEPKADQYPEGPPVDSRIDVYLVRPHLCKSRDGVCTPIPLDDDGEPALGAVAATTPCEVGSGGTATAASFMLLDVTQIAPRAGGRWPARHTFAHEFFHIMQNTWNYEARGGTCNGTRPAADVVQSWLVETWAEWAAGAYFPDDAPEDRDALFRQYQSTRDGAYISLRRYDPEPYDAFIYPLFVEQETSRQDALAVWKSSGGARTPEQLDQRANGALPFQEHFRDFAVRNFNDATLPGDPLPLSARYQWVDDAIPSNVRPIIVEPAVVLDFPVDKLPLTTLMQPLSAEYRHFTVDEHIAFVRIDLAPLTNATFAQMDAIVKIGDDWERRPVPGTVFEFCREDPEDDIEQFYLVLSNHGFVDGAEVSGKYDATALFDCPGGWTGSFELITTLDEYAAEALPGGYSYSLSEHSREEQRWTVSSSEMVLDPCRTTS